MNELPEITEIKRLQLQPGDKLCVECSTPVSFEQSKRIHAMVKRWSGLEDRDILITVNGTKISVLQENDKCI